MMYVFTNGNAVYQKRYYSPPPWQLKVSHACYKWHIDIYFYDFINKLFMAFGLRFVCCFAV